MKEPQNKTEDSWEIEFENKVKMPSSHLEAENSLYGEEIYPESTYELSADKIKDFIKSLLTLREQQIRGEYEGK